MAFLRGSWLRASSCFLIVTCLISTSTCATSPPASTFVLPGDSGDPATNFTVSINVPSDNQNDDLFFHVTAPSAQSYVAFGFGSQMADSLMFVIYNSQVQGGNNVTVSPRKGTGHVMPMYDSSVNVTVLAGSGIINDTYVVNAQCFNCRNWGVASLDVSSTSAPMIYAFGYPSSNIGGGISTALQQHQAEGTFSLNLQAATGAGGVPTNISDATVANPVGEGDSMNRSGALHAVLMVAAWVIVFPAGALFLRVFEKLWIHQGLQIFGVFVVLVGAALGIYTSEKHDLNPGLNSPHQGLGLAVVAFLLIQLVLGAVHHRMFKAHGRPTIMGKIHRYGGPALLALGIIEGVLGFNFAGNNRYIIGYAILVVIMLIVVGTATFFKRRRQRRKQAMSTPAAENFRQGRMDPDDVGEPVPLQQYGQQSYSLPGQQYDPPPPRYGDAPRL